MTVSIRKLGQSPMPSQGDLVIVAENINITIVLGVSLTQLHGLKSQHPMRDRLYEFGLPILVRFLAHHYCWV